MMRRPLALLATVLALWAFSGPGRAESACGSDTSSDPVVAMGKDVWLNGYCDSFLLCKQVVAQFHGCQAAAGFLSRLGAKEGQPLTADQVADALVKTTGTSTNMTACLWNFDAQGCKRYLGIGTGGSDSAAQGGEATAPAAAASPERKRAMSQNAALVARQRVRDMDANAHTAVGVTERACRAGADECRNTLESLVTPVIQATDELNANHEYLAHFPPHVPSSTEYAGRLGWTRQNGQWVFGGARAGQSTLKNYLLSVDDCRKLQDRLGQEVKAKPGQEPVELSFFEAECLPQMSDAQALVAAWRQGFKNTPTTLAAADASRQVPGSQAMEDLNQWDGGIRQAEAAQKKAREEEARRVAEQKRTEEERQRLAEQASRAQTEAVQGGSSRVGLPDLSRSSCVAELRDEYIDAKARSATQSNGKSYAVNREGVARHLDRLIEGAAQWGNNGDLKNARADIEKRLRDDLVLRQGVSGGNLDMVDGRIAEYKMHICLYSALLNDAGAKSNKIAMSASPRGSSLSVQECDARVRVLNATRVPSSASITASMETTMFLLKTQMEMTDGGCPPNPGITPAQVVAARKQWQSSYEAAENACNQVQSGGRRCVARNHFGPG